MHRIAFLFAGFVLLVVGCGGGSTDEPQADVAAAAPAEPAPPSAQALEIGRGHYRNGCALCHGDKGHGDGPMASSLFQKPRSFVNEPWKFVDASTPAGLREGLDRVIREGIPAANMPAFGSNLSDEQIRTVTEYVLHLRHQGAADSG